MIYIGIFLLSLLLGGDIAVLIKGEMYTSMKNEPGIWKNRLLWGNQDVDPFHIRGIRARIIALGFMVFIGAVTPQLFVNTGVTFSDLMSSPISLLLTAVSITAGIIGGWAYIVSRNKKMKIKYIGNGISIE